VLGDLRAAGDGGDGEAMGVRANVIKALDEVTAKIVKRRDLNRCQYCGRISKYLDWAHIYTRGDKRLRWDLNNAVALCRPHHSKLDLSPREKKAWFRDKFPDRAAYLDARRTVACQTVRTTELKSLLRDYRELLDKWEDA